MLILKRPVSSIILWLLRLTWRLWYIIAVFFRIERPPPLQHLPIFKTQRTILLSFLNNVRQFNYFVLQLLKKPDTLIQPKILIINIKRMPQPHVVHREFNNLKVRIEREAVQKSDECFYGADYDECDRKLRSHQHFF